MQPSKRFFLSFFILFALAMLPFLYDSRTWLILFSQIFIFAVFAMSYDLLLGYTGVVSFGHAMFFGIGAYTFALFMKKADESTMSTVLLAALVTIALSMILSFIIGMLTLRLKNHYFAMLTLAVAGLLMVAAEKWRSLTMGNDGFTFMVPALLRDRWSFYFVSLLFMVISYFCLRRFTESPLGKVLAAIRENETRAESLGYRVLYYRVIANVVAGMFAGLSGMLYAASLRFVNTSVFSTEITLDALLMTIIGGVGTLIGAIIGSGLIELAKHGLMGLAKVHWVFERWIIFFGMVYILAVMFFPKGIVGTIRQWRNKKANIDTTNREKAV
ncbi:branched-chain amino acid ABC transporter permease [Geobacillus sp. C56-T2]|uniref:branched-chain amino acid ABC transporter permease n=1 Tax=Geobacillus sp. C56-T2 TaxID=600773 RepID=UPI0011ADC4FA|nr:amino acid/amide ABC transporter membrane protein 2 (HAAT family) [Geobacillus sp. C56-T2]